MIRNDYAYHPEYIVRESMVVVKNFELRLRFPESNYEVLKSFSDEIISESKPCQFSPHALALNPFK